jgi:hypothetical protein
MQKRSYTRASVEDYQVVRRNGGKKVYRRKKRQYKKNKVQETEHLMNQNDTRKFYQGINKIWKDYKPQLKLCKERMDRLLVRTN